MNPKLQASGRKGGKATGPTKARPLDPQRARNMALARWRGVKASATIVQDGPQTHAKANREAFQPKNLSRVS